jgi:N-acetylneuraminate synthase
MPNIKIQDKIISEKSSTFIIAEAGINHNGDVKLAKKMIDAVKESGADAIKFQTFKAGEFVSDKKQVYEYISQGKKVKESMYEMFKRCELKERDYIEISEYCKKNKVIFFSTPQNMSDLDFLMTLGVPVIKVGSDDLTNLPLLADFASRGLPIMISTGMSYIDEIDEAVQTIKKRNNKLVIFHCISSYPAMPDELNLNNIITLKKRYPDCIIGFSDHSEGTYAAYAAVALGAKVYERHFTLDKDMAGPDHKFSANPQELKLIVKNIRDIEKALGGFEVKPTANEMHMRKLCRRSVVAAKDLKKWQVLTKAELTLKRPGTGIKPKELESLIGKKLKKDIRKDELIKLKHLFQE